MARVEQRRSSPVSTADRQVLVAVAAAVVVVVK